ncbi:hypothetical protein U9M48_012629 [Paspalum notatum var. saurae]
MAAVGRVEGRRRAARLEMAAVGCAEGKVGDGGDITISRAGAQSMALGGGAPSMADGDWGLLEAVDRGPYFACTSHKEGRGSSEEGSLPSSSVTGLQESAAG